MWQRGKERGDKKGRRKERGETGGQRQNEGRKKTCTIVKVRDKVEGGKIKK